MGAFIGVVAPGSTSPPPITGSVSVMRAEAGRGVLFQVVPSGVVVTNQGVLSFRHSTNDCSGTRFLQDGTADPLLVTALAYPGPLLAFQKGPPETLADRSQEDFGIDATTCVGFGGTVLAPNVCCLAEDTACGGAPCTYPAAPADLLDLGTLVPPFAIE